MMASGGSALDVGARGGAISLRLTEGFDEVVALDLVEPPVVHHRIRAVKGDATQMQFPDDSFDSVLCAEMLEHLPSPLLERACRELARVTRRSLVVGVPYKQDIRIGRTTCFTCGKPNPPWGHVNSFDEDSLRRLFPDLEWARVQYVGTSEPSTNKVSAFLMDLAGNPYGSYDQEEACVHCNARMLPAGPPSLLRRLVVKPAIFLQTLQRPFVTPHANWIHVLLTKPTGHPNRPSAAVPPDEQMAARTAR